MSKLSQVLIVAGLLAAIGCSTNTSSESPMVLNDTCPMMGEQIDATLEMTDWHGDRVGYCCKGCKGKFEALPEEEQAEKLREQGVDV